jgi:hypothetical protein
MHDHASVIIRHRHDETADKPFVRSSARAGHCGQAAAAVAAVAHSLSEFHTMPVALIVTATIDESRIEEFLIAIEIGACAHGLF